MGFGIVVRGGAGGTPTARYLSTFGRTVENAAVSWSRVRVSVLSAWLTGTAMNSTCLQYLLRAVKRGRYFSFFFSNIMSQPRFLQKPISMMMRVHVFLSMEIGSGERVLSIPPAEMRSDVVLCQALNINWVSSCGRIQSGRRWGAAVHSASPFAAESPQWLYLGT